MSANALAFYIDELCSKKVLNKDFFLIKNIDFFHLTDIIHKQQGGTTMTRKIQYASIPIESLEINSSNKKLSIKTFKPVFKLSRLNPYRKRRMKNVIVKIEMNKKPYIEELITKNKIGLNKNDNYKIYLKGDTIYNQCTKEEAYLKVTEQINYRKEVDKLFKSV